MSKVVFFTWPGGGNQPPAIGLAQELIRHGHTVKFAGYPVQVDSFAGLGLDLTPMTRSSQGWRPVDPEHSHGPARRPGVGLHRPSTLTSPRS